MHLAIGALFPARAWYGGVRNQWHLPKKVSGSSGEQSSRGRSSDWIERSISRQPHGRSMNMTISKSAAGGTGYRD
jgi:hypothetical protein